jgi:glycosyltransferase involved in cell wall biosynthesis
MTAPAREYDPIGDRVAIIVPCYNAERTLAATLESALMQDVPFEIIVVDDGSRDASLSIARSFEPDVRVVTGPNRGASAARNSGIAATTAPWILFLDSDDLLEAGTLRQRLAVARMQDADVVICDWLEILDDGSAGIVERARHSIDWPALEADPQIAIASHVWATTAAVLYSRAIVEQIGGFNLSLPIIQDARFLFDAAYHGGRFARAPHVGARYRVLVGSLSRGNPGEFAQDLLTNSIQIGERWRARGRLNDLQRTTLLKMLNTSGRSLFAAGHADYFAAIEAQRALDLPLPRHSRLAPKLAGLLGLGGARRVLRAFGKG